MKRNRQRVQFIDLRPALAPFVPLLATQNWEVREEATANKQFHLGRKEFEYVSTLTGHEPQIQTE